jgi:hypothetical protein
MVHIVKRDAQGLPNVAAPGGLTTQWFNDFEATDNGITAKFTVTVFAGDLITAEQMAKAKLTQFFSDLIISHIP